MNIITAIFKYTMLSSGGDMPEASIISFDFEMIKNLIFIELNVIVLVIILALVLYKPVRTFMDNRARGIQENIEAAERQRAEAEALKAECERQLAQVQKEREKILEAANKKAMERSEALLKEAQDEINRLQKHAMSELEEERVQMEEELRREIIELSVRIAEQFISLSIDEASQTQMIDKAIADWGEHKWLS